jgi:hypothetical protein
MLHRGMAALSDRPALGENEVDDVERRASEVEHEGEQGGASKQVYIHVYIYIYICIYIYIYMSVEREGELGGGASSRYRSMYIYMMYLLYHNRSQVFLCVHVYGIITS